MARRDAPGAASTNSGRAGRRQAGGGGISNSARFRWGHEWAAVLVSLVAAVASVVTIVIAVRSSNDEIKNSRDQFTRSSREGLYWKIVEGLGSEAPAVQSNSMRMLNLYVQDVSNFDGDTGRQRVAVAQALATLATFVRQVSGETSNGLPAFTSDVPIIVEPAFREISDLASNWRLGNHGFDLNEADLHGLNVPDFSTLGNFAAPAADFRRANLRNMILVDGDFEGAFFTCANLTGSDLGGADVQFADFTGADLSKADLSLVQNLTIQQLTGVRIGDDTRLPADVAQQVAARKAANTWPEAWLDREDDPCPRVARHMTRMLSAQGYSPEVPCPIPDPSVSPDEPEYTQAWRDSPLLRGRIAATNFDEVVPRLIAVCRARETGTFQ